MKKIYGSNLWLLAGIVVLGIGAIEFYQTSVSPRIHPANAANYNVN